MRDGGARLAHDDPRRDVRQPHRDRQRQARRDSGGQRGQRRVATAGGIVNLPRLGREMPGARLVHQRHAVIAARHHDGAEREALAQHGRGGHDPGLGVHAHAGRGGEFGAVRHHDAGARVTGEIHAARIDDHRPPGLARRRHQPHGRVAAQYALAVIGQHGHRGRRHGVDRDADHALGQPWVDRVRLLPVSAENLMAFGEEAGFLRRGAAALHQQPGLDIGLTAHQRGQFRPRLIVADHGDERHG